MKIKICGMSDAKNIAEIASLSPDFMGFIFYPESIRFIKDEKSIDIMKNHPKVKKVGVFVNSSIDYIQQKIKRHNFSYIQLHGGESVDFCSNLKKNSSCKIIKSFGIDENFDFSIANAYQSIVDYIMFDTKSSRYGGSGISFNWQLLKNYQAKLPIFLSGGLSVENINKVKKLPFIKIFALDFNSKLEKEKAIKDLDLVKQIL